MEENITNTETVETNETAENKSPAKTAEEQLAELLAENKRLKRANDKASSDAAEWKRKFTATQTESEKLSMEKAEKDAALRDELEMLRRESKINKFAKSFMAMGYSEEMANKAAEAQFDGDTEELFRIQKLYNTEAEKRIRAEIMKTMPVPSTSNDDSIQMTQEQFDKLQYAELKELFEKHPSVYEKFVKR